MPEGYFRGKPKLDWWQQQVADGIKYRQEHAHEKRWDEWRKYYRGRWSEDVLPSNLFFKMARTIIPRVYFRNPSVSIYPARPGLETMIFAKILQRVDNKLLKHMGMKKEMKRIAQNAFFFGTGIGKLGYGAEFTPTPDEGATREPLVDDKYRVEYSARIQQNMPWFRSVHPGDFVVPEGADRLEDSRWVTHIIRRPYDDVLNDPRLSNTGKLKEGRAGPEVESLRKNAKPGPDDNEIELWEIRDKKTQRVIILAPYNTDEVLLDEKDEMQIYGRVPFYEAVFNPDDEVFWGVPDSQILEPLQLELNENRTLEQKHRRMSLVKLLVKRNGMDREEAEKLVNEDVLPVAFTNENPANVIEQMQVAGVPEDLITAIGETMQDARETVGFGRNQFGEYNPNTSGDVSATEAQIVKQATEIRVDERRDMMADLLTEVIQDMNQIIFEQWDSEEVIDVVGPQGVPVWVTFRPEMLDPKQFEVHIDPDSSVPETKQMREQKAIQVYQTFRKDPMINQEQMVRHTLTELNGAEYETFMNVTGGRGMGMENPMSIQDLMNLVQEVEGQQAGEVGGRAPGVSNNPSTETLGEERASGAAQRNIG